MMRKIVHVLTALAVCGALVFAGSKDVKAATDTFGGPTIATTIQPVQFGFNPGKIILPYGAMLAQDAAGNWVLAFLDTSVAVLNSKTGVVPLANGFTVALTGGEIVYSKNINGMPIKVTYNLSNCIARVDAGNKMVFYKNGSILSSIVTNNGPTYTIETYNDSGAILRNETRNSLTNQMIFLDDYVRTPGMIIRTFYDMNGTPVSVLPYYGDTKPAY
ncbi:MAG: hypothetical protein IJU25_01705 [Lachnospiraceae bacterium]|nr:hypothetical protein [Lachnospiraceae bacterium]